MRDLPGSGPVPKPVNRKANKARGRSMENSVARVLRDAGDVGAKRVALSGAIKDGSLPMCDVTGSMADIECKNRSPIQGATSRYVRFDLDWLTKLEAETATSGLLKVVVLQPKGVAITETISVMRTGALLTILGKLAQLTRSPE